MTEDLDVRCLREVRYRYDKHTDVTLTHEDLLVAYRGALTALDREVGFRRQLMCYFNEFLTRMRRSDAWTTQRLEDGT